LHGVNKEKIPKDDGLKDHEDSLFLRWLQGTLPWQVLEAGNASNPPPQKEGKSGNLVSSFETLPTAKTLGA